MKKLVSNILFAVVSVCFLLVTGCEEQLEVVESPYLDVVPETYSDAALGEGDAFLLSIRSNVEWALSAVDNSGNPVEWIRFDITSGKGNADVLGFVLRGDRETDRNCTIVLTTNDSKLDKSLTIQQGVFVPVMLKMDMSDILKSGYPLAAGESEVLMDFGTCQVEVVAVPGDNLPEGYIYVTDNGFDFVRIKTAQASTINVGDKLLIEFTDGKVTKDANGGYTAELPATIRVEASGAPTIKPVFISADAVSRYENALVAVGYAQAQDGSIGKNWSGDVQMTTQQIQGGSAFTVHVDSKASFASGTVPASSGQVVGIVKEGKVCPRSADDLAGLTAERKDAYVEPYQITTLGNYFKATAKSVYANASIVNKSKLLLKAEHEFSQDGASVEKVGGTPAQTALAIVNNSLPYECCFTTKGWTIAGSYLLFTMPVTGKICGDLDFNFSVSTAKASETFGGANWNVQWSSDKSNWHDVDAVYCTNKTSADAAKGNIFSLTVNSHQANRQVAEFSIPESEALTSGFLYIKVASPTAKKNNTVRVNCGFSLSSRPTDTPDYGFDNVLAMENFSRVLYGHNPVIGHPVYYMVNHINAPGYSNSEGWAAMGTVGVYKGCIHLSASSGRLCMISPILDMLQAPTDIYVSFKVAPSWFVSAGKGHTMNDADVSVDVTGSGTVGQIEWDAEFKSRPYGWHTGKVKISGASSDTQVNIGVTDSGAGASQFYIDDVIITR